METRLENSLPTKFRGPVLKLPYPSLSTSNYSTLYNLKDDPYMKHPDTVHLLKLSLPSLPFPRPTK